MPFEVHTGEQAPSGVMKSDRRLCLTADDTLVEEGDPRAVKLLCPAGGMITSQEVTRLGLSLVDGRVVQASAEAKEEKELDAPDEDKELEKPADKAKGKPKTK